MPYPGESPIRLVNASSLSDSVDSIFAGCGGANYCPDNAVTRGRMAVFLVKAFGL